MNTCLRPFPGIDTWAIKIKEKTFKQSAKAEIEEIRCYLSTDNWKLIIFQFLRKPCENSIVYNSLALKMHLQLLSR